MIGNDGFLDFSLMRFFRTVDRSLILGAEDI